MSARPWLEIENFKQDARAVPLLKEMDAGWREIPYGFQFKFGNGAILTWYWTTRTATWQDESSGSTTTFPMSSPLVNILRIYKPIYVKQKGQQGTAPQHGVVQHPRRFQGDSGIKSHPKLPGEREDLVCAELGCGGRLVLRVSWVNPPKFSPFYGCAKWRETECPGSIPANEDGSPRGNPRTHRLKRIRIQAHDFFDALWLPGGLMRSRGAAYEWLAKEMGLTPKDTHIGLFSEEQCERVINLVADYRKGPRTSRP